MKKLFILAVALIPLGALFLLLISGISYKINSVINKDEVSLERFTQLAEGQRFKEAEEELKSMILSGGSRDELMAVAFYNLGNVSLGEAFSGDEKAAREAARYWKESLRLDPFLWPAKFNLELLYRLNPKSQQKQRFDLRPGPGQNQLDVGGEEGSKGGPTIPPVSNLRDNP